MPLVAFSKPIFTAFGHGLGTDVREYGAGSAQGRALCSRCGRQGALRRARALPNLRLLYKTLCRQCQLAGGWNYPLERPAIFDEFEEAA